MELVIARSGREETFLNLSQEKLFQLLKILIWIMKNYNQQTYIEL